MGIRTWLGLKKKIVDPRRPSFWNAHSYSQLQQDRWVLAELGEKRGGFFVEVGAFDGKQLSNTFLLEAEYDWRGILAEPNPLFTEQIQKVRPASILCKQPVDEASGKPVTMRFVKEHPELSSMSDNVSADGHAKSRQKESVEVVQTTISLNDLLDASAAPAQIDFISIDTEGNEPAILKSFDFARFDVRLFCIEHNNTSANRKLDEILLPHGYERVYREWSRWDAWYRKA